jgi:hypothetical protein
MEFDLNFTYMLLGAIIDGNAYHKNIMFIKKNPYHKNIMFIKKNHQEV